MCVLAYTVDAGIFNPPDTALNQIGSHVAVALVEVRHTLGEPAVYCYFLFIIGSVRVRLCGGLEGSLHVVAFEVEPVFGGHILE